MKMKMKPIPINKHGWLDYQNMCYVIKLDVNGSIAKYQYNGIVCMQGIVRGYVVATIKNSFKWFDYKWWYSLCRDKDYLSHTDNKSKVSTWQKTDVLLAIVKEVERCTGMKFDEIDTSSFYWKESYIPVSSNGKHYFITWQNCD